MRLIIKEYGKIGLRIYLPSWLAMNRLSASFLAARISGDSGSISSEQLHTLFRAVKAYKAQHPDWKLIEVQSADGDYIEIVP